MTHVGAARDVRGVDGLDVLGAAFNLEKAMRSNRVYGSTLGWKSEMPRIRALLRLPSVHDDAQLARAIFGWQRRRRLTADGMLGPLSWRRMKPELERVALKEPPLNETDIIKRNFAVVAQESLFRLVSRRRTNLIARRIVFAVKRGLLGGVFRANMRVPALRARQLGIGWWQLVPRGRNAICLARPPGQRPIIVLRPGLTPRQVDAALMRAWLECNITTPPPPPYVPIGIRRPPPPVLRRRPPASRRPPTSRPSRPPRLPRRPQAPFCRIRGKSASIRSTHPKFVKVQGVGVLGTFRTNASAAIPVNARVPCQLFVDAQIQSAVIVRQSLTVFGSFVVKVNGKQLGKRVQLRPRRASALPADMRDIGQATVRVPSGVRSLEVVLLTGYTLSPGGGRVQVSATDTIRVI